MFRVVKDLKALKKPFKRLAWKDGDIFENIKVLRDRLKDVQSKIDVDPSNKVLREEESSILLMYNDAMCDEEQLLFQKAKIKWLSMGDRNNEFFHRVVKSRNHRNRVNAIHDEDGSRFKGDHVAAQFVKYFQNFLGKNVPVCKIDDMGVLFKNKLGPDEAEFMVRDVSNKEINQAIFLIDDNKAPGPDGFSAYFYKKAWDIIGNDICSAILTERMKKCLGRLVSQNQSAFIPNRQIQENILISQELLKGHDREDGPKRVALKIDLQKAYDTVNWSFLEDILRGYFKGGRGIRQGDPIKLKITHVCFADDLFMFSHGDKESVRIMKDSTKEFGKATVFLLPQAIIDEINSLLKGFLWNQEEKANGRAKVAWNNLCKPKSQGGLGIGDGSTTFMWFDYWNDMGILSDMVTYRDLYDARFQANMTVQDFIKDRNGQWPEENDEDQVRWSKLVWFSQNIPKHAFIPWLAILGRLTTQDKIRSWGSYDLMVCPLCCNEMDSHEHLIVRRLCLAASVYFIWQERNSRNFRNEKRKVDMIFKALCDTIKLRLYSLKVRATKDVINIEKAWEIRMNYYGDLKEGNAI
ncbi:RNA-directed DNA polymerase, eukaryota, reverse transcriptase zinc-binding domain protein [Tanacetum coccineum]